MYMSSEGEKMSMANMRLAISGDGAAAAVYKPVMPTETYPPQSQPATATVTTAGGDISFLQPHQHQHHHHQYANSTSFSGGSGGEPEKRKRGRPRKYGPHNPSDAPTNANTCMALNLTSPPSTVPSNDNSTSNSTKKPRGRPPGSFRKQHSADFGLAGVGFTPHVITVQAGEDVLAKVMSFSQNGPRAVCILSANGAISSVTLRQAMTSGGTVTYEGRFEILSLSGSILLSESSGQRSRTGGLSVSLAGPDGRVLGGGVAGLLTAASPVQVIVGSFLAEGWKGAKAGIQSEPLSSTPNHVARASTVGSPLSRGNFSESSGGPGSPLNQSTGGCSNSNPAGIPNISWK